MKYNKGKCRVSHLGRNSRRYRYRLGTDLLESSIEERDHGVHGRMTVSQHCAILASTGVYVGKCSRTEDSSDFAACWTGLPKTVAQVSV